MDKPLCEWCSDKEYHIAIPKESGGEELLCSDCYEQFKMREAGE